ncbi:unnamed protein product [Prorocentrum cordatum]|uniref:Uncharacterized protein n=1 Tax=Prorocentrum cordatum TaxID=2364126 RepID=A0ABN9X2R1_9DINO|nr:unnamed protein product [Polarella glacialis]
MAADQLDRYAQWLAGQGPVPGATRGVAAGADPLFLGECPEQRAARTEEHLRQFAVLLEFERLLATVPPGMFGCNPCGVNLKLCPGPKSGAIRPNPA